MANKVLDLLLQLTVKGTEQAAALGKAVETLKASVQNFKGRSLDDILAGSGETVAKIDLVVSKVRLLRSQFDLVLQAGKTPIDFNLDKVEKDATRAAAETRKLGEQLQELKRKAGLLPPLQPLAPLNKETEEATRNTSALTQRINSMTRELLLLRRAVFGLGFSFVGKEAVDVAISFDRIHQSLTAAFDSAQQGAVEFEFLKETAERLGLSINTLADRYSKLVLAGRQLGLDNVQIKDTFLAVAEAGARFHLSTEQIDNALLAVEQIASKGTVSMEELRRQLGNSIPGAVPIFAKAMGITTAKLFELVEAGQLSSKVFFQTFPAAIRAAFGTDSTTRIETTSASIERFKNRLKLFTDEIIRAGVLDAFVKTLGDLTKLMSNNDFVDGVKKAASVLGELLNFIRENAKELGLLLKVFLEYKALGIVISVIGSIRNAFAGLAALAGPLAATAVASKAVAASTTAVAAGAAAAAPAVLTLGGAVSKIATALAHPLVLTVAVAGGVAVELLLNHLSKVKEAELELADAQRTLQSNDRLANLFEQQANALKEFSDTAILTGNEIITLSKDGQVEYAKQAEAARTFFELEAKALQASLTARKLELDLINKKDEKSDKDLIRALQLRDQIELITKAQADATDKGKQYTTVIDNIATAQGGAAIKTANLTPLMKSQLEVFNQAIAAGKGLKESLEKAIPANFADGGITSIKEVLNFLQLLQETSGATAKVIEETIAKKLDKLTGEDLQKFQIVARQAFLQGDLSAQAFALTINGTVRAAVKDMGLDVDTEGKKVSKKFADLARDLQVVAEEAKDAGQLLKSAIEHGISTAKTRDELIHLKETLDIITDTAIRKGFGPIIFDSLVRLDNKIRETSGVLDSSLGDAFKRLGIETAERIHGLADLAVTDFIAIKESGLATARDLRIAFGNAFDLSVAGKAFKDFGLVAQTVLLNTRDQAFENFGVIANSGQASAETIRQAWLKMNQAQLESQGLTRESIDLNQRFLDNLTRPLDSVLAAAQQLGVKTRSELQLTAAASQEAFRIMKESGEFTFAELEKAAQKLNEDIRAAFDLLEEGPTIQRRVVSGTVGGPRISPQGARSLSDSDLTQTIKDLVQALEDDRIKFGGFGNPVTANIMNRILDDLRTLREEQSRRGQPTTINFNFQGTDITPDTVRRFIIPALNDFYARGR